MPEDVLIVGSSFDSSGLDAGLVAGAARVQKFADTVEHLIATLPPLQFNAGTTDKSLGETESALKRLVAEARDLNNLPLLNTTDAQREVVELAAAFGGLEGALAKIDPSGVLRRVAADTQAVVIEMQRLAAATAAAPVGGAALGVSPTAGAGPRVIRDKVAELRLLAGQLQQVAPLENAVGIGAQKMAAGMAAATRTVHPMTAAMAAAAQQSQQTAVGFAVSNRSANLFRSGLVGLAVQATGTTGTIGQLAQGALFAAGGIGAVAAFAAAVLAAAKVHDILTTSQRQARKAHDDLVTSLNQRVEGAIAGNPANQRGAVRSDIQRLQIQEAQLEERIRTVGLDVVQGLVLRLRLRGNIAEQQRLSLNLARDEAQEEKDKAAARFGPGRDRVADLSRELQVLQTSEAAVRRLEIAGSNLTAGQKQAAIAIFDETQALIAQKKAAEELTKVLVKQHETRVRNAAGGGNLVPGAGGTNTGPVRGGLLPGASAEEITNSRGVQSIKEMEDALKGFFKTAFAGFNALANHQAAAALRWVGLAKAFSKAGTAAFGLADVGSALGLIGDNAARALEDVGRLGDSLAAVAAEAALGKGISFGTGVGVAVAGAQLLGQAIGPNAGEIERANLLRQNNERLAELRASLDRTIQGGSAIGENAERARLLSLTPETRNLAGLNAVDTRVQMAANQEAFERALAASGYTVQQWADEVKAQTGLDVLDSKGRLVAETLTQVDAGFKEVIRRMLEVEDSIVARAARAEVRDKLFQTGGDPGVGALQRQRESLIRGLNLPDADEKRVLGLDLTSEEGRARYREWLQWVYRMGEAGKFTVEQLGKFENVDQIIASAGVGADALAAAEEEAARRIAEANAEAAAAAADLAQKLAEAAARLNEFRVGQISDRGARAQLLGQSSQVEFGQLRELLTGGGGLVSAPLIAALAKLNTSDESSRETFKLGLAQFLDRVQLGLGGADLAGLTPESMEALILQLGGLVDTIGQDLETYGAERLRLLADERAAAEERLRLVQEERVQALQLADLRARLVGGEVDAAAQFQRQLENLSQAMPSLEDALGGFDLGDPAGRDALRARMLKLFDQFSAGGFKDLGVSKDELLALFGTGADYLDSFNESVNAATKSMTNLPQGLNLAEFQWRARLQAPPSAPGSSSRLALPSGREVLAPPSVPGAPSRLAPPTRREDLAPVPIRGGDGAALPFLQTVTRTDQTLTKLDTTLARQDTTIAKMGDALNAIISKGTVLQITIDGGTKSSQQIQDDILRALSQIGMTRSGSPIDLG